MIALPTIVITAVLITVGAGLVAVITITPVITVPIITMLIVWVGLPTAALIIALMFFILLRLIALMRLALAVSGGMILRVRSYAGTDRGEGKRRSGEGMCGFIHGRFNGASRPDRHTRARNRNC